MAPTLGTTFRRLVSASASTVPTSDVNGPGALPVDSPGGPLQEATRLFARDEPAQTVDPSSGVLDPHDIKNVGFFVLFALIGVGFVVTGIWFFFWAKNGGFYFRQDDWDDYKTTVLRRKGPNGTLLSGATESTNLGGGSVYKDVEDDGTTVVTESTGLSGVTAGASDIAAREKRRKKQEQRDRAREKKRKDKKSSGGGSSSNNNTNNNSKRHVGQNGVEDEMAEKEAKQFLRNYRHEKSARVGGLNKESDGSAWDGSTNPTASEMTTTDASTELLSHRQDTPTGTPTGTPTKPSGIRKVYSTADRTADRETERIRAEARRLREAGRASAGAGSPSRDGVSRRDFSYQRAAASRDGSEVTESLLTGSEVGTKSYHHPMPELREHRERAREERRERRERRGGYRRGRGEDDI